MLSSVTQSMVNGTSIAQWLSGGQPTLQPWTGGDFTEQWSATVFAPDPALPLTDRTMRRDIVETNHSK